MREPQHKLCVVLQNPRKHLCRRPEDNLVEGLGVEWFFRTHIGRSYPALVGDVYQSRSGIDRSGSAYNQQPGRPIEFGIDAFHVQGNFAEPHDVRPNRLATFSTLRQFGSGLIEGLIGERHIAFHAARLEKGSVHVVKAVCTSALMKVVDILRAEIETIAQFSLNVR